MDAKKFIKRFLILILNFAVFYGILRISIEVGERTGQAWLYYLVTVLLAVALVALFVAFFILNGFTFNTNLTDPEELPDEWDEEQKQAFLEKQETGKRKAKKLIYFIRPLIMTAGVSFIELHFFR